MSRGAYDRCHSMTDAGECQRPALAEQSRMRTENTKAHLLAGRSVDFHHATSQEDDRWILLLRPVHSQHQFTESRWTGFRQKRGKLIVRTTKNFLDAESRGTRDKKQACMAALKELSILLTESGCSVQLLCPFLSLDFHFHLYRLVFFQLMLMTSIYRNIIPEGENMPYRYDLQLCWNSRSRFDSKNDTFLSKQRAETDPHFFKKLVVYNLKACCGEGALPKEVSQHQKE